MNYIKHLPINDTPEIFGLHDNANITFAQNETFSLLNGILKLQPKSAVGAGKSREEVKIEYVFFSLFFFNNVQTNFFCQQNQYDFYGTFKPK